jgi:choline dehydrogenase
MKMARFDVVIVGGGSAGCVLACRLSANPTCRVLLLEGGAAYPPDRYPLSLADADQLGGGTEHDWGFHSESARLGYSIAAQSGRVLGGGSAINAGVAKRATANDFALWRRHGIDGWAFEDVLKTYKALENTPTGEDDWHGRSGPLPIRQPGVADVTPALRAFVEASIAAGFRWIDDSNGPVQHGVAIDPLNVVDGVRQNAGMVYLNTEVRKRPNLTIRGRAQVDRIELKGQRADGVCLIGGETVQAGEVILCAGVYGSPAILLRSGIGPAHHLREHGIGVVADLPVGERLHDHPFYYNTYALKPEAGAMHPARGATIWTSSAKASGDELDLQITASNSFDQAESLAGRTLVLATAVTTPWSVGSVRLKSRDPCVAPRIDYNLLAHPCDRRRLLEGVRLARRIGHTRPLADLVDHEVTPGSRVESDDALEAAVEEHLDTYHHGSCTVPMGGAGDHGAVVDAAGRLRNVEGLRVADASIFPEIPSTPTNLTTIMLAERIAASILGGSVQSLSSPPERFRRSAVM